MKKYFFGIILIIILIAIFTENKEEKIDVKSSDNKVKTMNPNDISTFGINIRASPKTQTTKNQYF